MTGTLTEITKRPVPTPAEAMIAYARQAGIGNHDSQLELPELLNVSLTERCHQIASGQWDHDAWTRQVEAWVRTADPRYRAFVTRRQPESLAPAVRVAVKDTIDVAGFPTGLGLRHYRHHPTTSAFAIAHLEQAVQAQVIGKVVSTELNIGIGSGCVNPYFPHIDPAGSSTGSGVAVAANLCDLAIGTDVLGSVRWPAGHCGTVGLRTSHNPHLLGGVFPLSPPLDAVGWVARSAKDLAFLWRHLSLRNLVNQANIGIGRHHRIGVVDNVRDGSCSPEMAETVDMVCGWLADDGHAVDPIRLDDLWRSRGDAWQLCARQAWDGYQLWRKWITVPLHDSTKRALEIGSRVGDRQYGAILADMEVARRDVAARFDEDWRVWLLPLDPSAPPDLRVSRASMSTIPAPCDPDYDRRVGYTPIASFVGLPAITVPARLSPINRAPLAVQIVGPPGSEELLIDLAERVQHRAGDLDVRPM